MSTQVVVTLPDDLYAQAQHWAALTHREVPQLLTEALALVLTPIGTPPVDAPPVATLSDAEVLALAQVQMAPQQGHRLDQLLAQQGEATLTTQEQAELLALMQVYQQLWVRQSEALAEARPPWSTCTADPVMALPLSATLRARCPPCRSESVRVLSHLAGVCALAARN